jgi:catechol 2,3-dioxygenase-like lactoylglutathione lyase family enzyme
MTSTTTATAPTSDSVQCGCCGTVVPTKKTTELMNTPGVHICSGCAVWAAVRLTRAGTAYVAAVRLLRRVGRLRRRPGHSEANGMRSATPILFCADVDRTCAYYTGLGLQLVERYDDGYLLMRAGDSEVHFTTDTVSSAPGEMFIHVTDAGALWKRLKAEGVTSLGPVEDQPWGLREFVATDPDGNRVRLGSQTPAP